MYTSEFAYKKAGSLAEAISLLQQHPDAELLAGGHSLIPTMKLRLASPSALIDISKVAELRGIRRDGDTLVIGAMTTYRELETSDLLKAHCPIIPQAVSLIGDPMVRAKGTIGGSLAHADPAADLPASMLALGAQIKVQGPSGSRVVEAEQFFTGMFSTALQEGEILTEVHIPVRPGARMAYAKFPHPASRYAVVGVAVVIGPGGLRAAVTGAGEHAMRLTQLEQALAGKALTAENIAAACQGLLPADNLNHDLVASKEYRAHLVDVMAKRALMQAAGL
ncbi:xanthine dehydrogenase family protein subunit M [Meiothermus sp.]|uniref:FAD binding domain-containing protein n=1 Tax=Meiothermus sp. TaxID=1955249 RepID=UPI00307EFB69